MANPKLLDLDAVAAEVDFVILLDRKEHKLQLATVDDFVSNVKAIESMKTDASLEKEIEVIITMLTRAFPSIGEPRLRKLNMVQLRAMNDFARGASGEKAELSQEDGAPAEGNVAAS